MENLQTLMKSGNMIKDAEIIPPNNDLINPRKNAKSEAELLGGNNEDDEEFQMDDEIFN